MAQRIMELTIDDSEARREINFLKTHMTPRQFNQAMYGVFRETGRHIGTILRKDLPKKYHVAKMGDITSTVQKPQMQMSNSNVGCVIPLRGPRKSIGGYYAAKGSARGWESTRKKYRVTARIVKGVESKLPAKMDDGGMPPFRNIPSKLGKVTFAREGKARFPIVSVKGIAIPQMPMNRSREDVERDIDSFLHKRIEQRVTALIVNGR